MNCQRVLNVTLFVFMFALSQVQAATPLGLGFTFQGHLERNGVPENGEVHLRFSLWDSPGTGQPPTGGAQIGASQLLSSVPVADGIFTVILNAGGEFGPNAVNGEARWLQIEVCADPGCGTLTILGPRQAITATPYSLRTLSAPWTGLTGVPAVFADGVDNIGEPQWTVNGTSIGYDTGSVGVGTTAPETKLQVNDGRIRIAETATGEDWDLFYDPPSQKFYLRENDAYNHLVFTKGPDPRIGIGEDEPNPNARVSIHAAKENHAALRGESENAPSGILGIARRVGAAGVEGYNNDGVGAYGVGKTGVEGFTLVPEGIAVHGHVGFDVSALAGLFEGTVVVNGTLVVNGALIRNGIVLKSGGGTRIDHPLDPEHKFLLHSSVESSEDMNIYNGNTELDASGEAEVVLPDWFMALNKDFRYQLTAIGGPGGNLHIAQEIENGEFRIGGGSPGLKVSWMVTGVRQDAWAKANPSVVEQEKSKEEIGKYQNPEVFGQPKEMGIHYRPATEVHADKYRRAE